MLTGNGLKLEIQKEYASSPFQNMPKPLRFIPSSNIQIVLPHSLPTNHIVLDDALKNPKPYPQILQDELVSHQNKTSFNEFFSNFMKEWKETESDKSDYEIPIFMTLLRGIFNYGNLLSVKRETDKNDQLTWYVFYFKNCSKEDWASMENNLGEIAHSLYLKYGDPVIRVRNLIHIECV